MKINNRYVSVGYAYCSNAKSFTLLLNASTLIMPGLNNWLVFAAYYFTPAMVWN